MIPIIVSEPGAWRLDHMERSVSHARLMAEWSERVQSLDEVEMAMASDRPVIPAPIVTSRRHYSFYECTRCSVRCGSRLAYMAHYVDEHLEKLG